MQNPGLVYRGRGQFEEAERMWKRALAGYERSPYGHKKFSLDIQYILGELFEQGARFNEAAATFAGAKAGYETLLGPNDPETVDAASRLESVRRKRSREGLRATIVRLLSHQLS